MEITVDGKVHEINITIGFIRKLDKQLIESVAGKETAASMKGFGVGLNHLHQQLENNSIMALIDGIKLTTELTEKKIEKYIESLDIDEIDELLQNFLHKLEKTPATGYQIQKVKDRKAAESNKK